VNRLEDINKSVEELVKAVYVLKSNIREMRKKIAEQEALLNVLSKNLDNLQVQIIKKLEGD